MPIKCYPKRCSFDTKLFSVCCTRIYQGHYCSAISKTNTPWTFKRWVVFSRKSFMESRPCHCRPRADGRRLMDVARAVVGGRMNAMAAVSCCTRRFTLCIHPMNTATRFCVKSRFEFYLAWSALSLLRFSQKKSNLPWFSLCGETTWSADDVAA